MATVVTRNGEMQISAEAANRCGTISDYLSMNADEPANLTRVSRIHMELIEEYTSNVASSVVKPADLPEEDRNCTDNLNEAEMLFLNKVLAMPHREYPAGWVLFMTLLRVADYLNYPELVSTCARYLVGTIKALDVVADPEAINKKFPMSAADIEHAKFLGYEEEVKAILAAMEGDAEPVSAAH